MFTVTSEYLELNIQAYLQDVVDSLHGTSCPGYPYVHPVRWLRLRQNGGKVRVVWLQWQERQIIINLTTAMPQHSASEWLVVLGGHIQELLHHVGCSCLQGAKSCIPI